MFKASIQRHARLGNVARRQISTFSSCRPVGFRTLAQQQQPLTNRILLATSKSAAPRQLTSRLYSSESAAAEENEPSSAAPPADADLVTRFEDLSRLGVHEKLIEALTQGMKYETMTDVQSLTINAALRGTDL